MSEASNSPSVNPSPIVADLQRELAGLRSEREEARAKQQLPKSCKPSTTHPAILLRCSTPSLKRRACCARRRAGNSRRSTANSSEANCPDALRFKRALLADQATLVPGRLRIADKSRDSWVHDRLLDPDRALPARADNGCGPIYQRRLSTHCPDDRAHHGPGRQPPSR